MCNTLTKAPGRVAMETEPRRESVAGAPRTDRDQLEWVEVAHSRLLSQQPQFSQGNTWGARAQEVRVTETARGRTGVFSLLTQVKNNITNSMPASVLVVATWLLVDEALGFR